MMSIEMIGSVYCPLSSRDPQHRLYALLQQTQSRLLLVHWLTNTKFNDDIISLDVDLMFYYNHIYNNYDLTTLSNVEVTPENISYTIFTSGSTGIPKPVSFEVFFDRVYRFIQYRLKRDIAILFNVLVLWFI
jgi:non-ribosomal peptide synthetase component F